MGSLVEKDQEVEQTRSTEIMAIKVVLFSGSSKTNGTNSGLLQKLCLFLLLEYCN